MQHSPQKSIISTGTASIVLIFVMLCLLTFSVLSLVSAQANLRLSQKSADRTTAYYAAENEANEVLLSLLKIMQRYENEDTADAFYQHVRSDAEAGCGVTFSSDQTVSYTVPLGDRHVLFVSLTITYDPVTQASGYQIDSWNTISQYEWDSDQPLPLPVTDSSQEEPS